MKYCIKRALSVALALALTIGMLTGIIVPASATERPVEHVVVIGLDGAGCLYNASTPNINKLMSTGASSMGCLVNYPTISGVNWTSMLNGVTYWEHGVNNDNIYGTPYTSTKYPSIFKVVRDAWPEAVLSSYVNWASPNRGAIENDIGVNKRDFWHENGADYEDSLLTAAAVEHIAEASPNLFFMQFDSIDAVGHSDGHDTDAQRAQITKVDGYIGQILDAIDANPEMKDNTIVILSADHGGDGKGHGLYLENSSKVFYVVAGKGINHNTDLGTMYLRDTPAIVAHALGVAGNPNWDSYIPKNLFIDYMTPPERNVLREAASKATPAADSEKYIGNHIDLDDLKAGYFFDAALEDITDNTRAESKGLVTYFDGYYGNSAHVSGDGYIAFDELTFGEESFSIALWVKRKPMENTDPPLYGNKDWNKGANPGFTFALYNGESRNSLVALADGTNRSDLAQPGTGTVQMDNWVHTLLVVDRSADKAFFYENFQKISEVGITKLGSLDSAYDFVLGRSGPDNYKRVPDALVDDLLIFNGAVGAQEIENLATYYGVEIPEDDTTDEPDGPTSPSEDDEEYIGNFIDVSNLKAGYFFDDELVDITENTEAVVEGSRVATYEEGYYGKALLGSATNYITIGEGEEMKNLNFTGTNGLDSFSIALWVKRDYTKTVDIALYGNKNWKSGKNQGIVGGVCSGPTRGTFYTCLADGSNRVDVNNKDNTKHAYSTDWVHTIVVVDRTAGKAYLYENFELISEGDISAVGSLSTDLPFTVGRSGGVNLNTRLDSANVLMDDLLIFSKAVGSKEIHALESYYGKATEHNWNTEYTVDKEATCGAAGSKSIHCADCNVQKADSVTAIPATGIHTAGELIVDTAPTATTEGVGHKACTACGTTVEANIVIPAIIPTYSTADGEKNISDYIELDDLKAGYFFDEKLQDIAENTKAEVAGSGEAAYEEGYYGKALLGSATDYITIGEGERMENLTFAGADGKASFSIALWVKRDYSKTTDIALYGNKNWKSGKNQGIVGGVCVGPYRGTFYTCLADGSNRVDVNNKDNTKHAYSTDWVHTIVVVDRTAGKAYLYENFELISEGDISKVGALSNDLPFTVGRSGGVYLNNRLDSANVLMDDLLIFSKAVGSKEIHALESYYGKATEHNWNTEYTVDKEATCGAAGSKSIYCADCNVQKADSITVIPATGNHTAGELIVDTEPTATTAGVGHKDCTVCGETVEENIAIPALGVASIDGTAYDTLEAALAEASAGDVVKLNKAVTVDYITVDPEVTLDLNGNTLTADYIIGFNGSTVCGEGKLIVAKDKVALDRTNGGYLPVYDGKGYRFITVTMRDAKKTNEQTGETYYYFSPDLTAAHDELSEGATPAALEVVVRLTWTKADNYKATQSFIYLDEMVKTVVESYNADLENHPMDYASVFLAAFAGSEAESAEDLTISAVLISNTGVEVASSGISFAG